MNINNYSIAKLGKLGRIRGARSRYAGAAGGAVLGGGGFVTDNGDWMFWQTNRRWATPELCEAMIEQILEAMSKALASGVVEYRVGSRSLRRFTLKELQDLLGFWTAQLEDALVGGRARRAAPCDV